LAISLLSFESFGPRFFTKDAINVVLNGKRSGMNMNAPCAEAEILATFPAHERIPTEIRGNPEKA